MDQIVSNFYILIPIAVVVALRIVEARKKAGAARPPGKAGAAPAGASQEDKPGPFNGMGGFPAGERVSAAPERKEPPSLWEGKALPPAGGDGLALAAPRNGPPAKGQQEEGGYLGRLSPLKRAVAFAEILGKPRGLEPYQNSF